MQKLVYYQLRIVAVIVLLLVSSTIIFSYVYFPANLAVTISDFYRQYWFLLTKLFILAAIFLVFACSVEREWIATSWPQRAIAFVVIIIFIKEFIALINIADLLLAFVD